MYLWYSYVYCMFWFTWICEQDWTFESFYSLELQVAMRASFFMISEARFLYYILTDTGTLTPSEPKFWEIPFRKHTFSTKFTNQINWIEPGKWWISNTPTQEGDHSPSYTTAKENQPPPSNPKANWRLTAFFTLGINSHVSWIKLCYNKASTIWWRSRKRKKYCW